MKKTNFWKLLSGTAFFAAVALASCVDDNDDKGMPYLEVTPDVLTFNADGAPEGASAFTVKSNRPWTLEVLEGSDWVTPSATQGSGDGTVEFTIPASNVGRIAKLSFNLKNAYGAYWTKEVTIEQGEAPKAGEVSALVAYIKNTWPSLESGTEELNYSQKTIPAVILANNEGGNNFGKLYVGDNITLPNSAIILYSTTEFTRDNSAKYPVGKKVTLDLSAAQYAPYGNLRELKNVVVTVSDDPAVEVAVPTLSAATLNEGNYQGQYVRVTNLTPQSSFVGEAWATSAKRVVRFDAAEARLSRAIWLRQPMPPVSPRSRSPTRRAPCSVPPNRISRTYRSSRPRLRTWPHSSLRGLRSASRPRITSCWLRRRALRRP